MNPHPLVIAIANRKGGTGKTTTAVNLTAAWGRQGKRTLLIDLDTQGHAAIGLGCDKMNENAVTIHHLLLDNTTKLMDAVVPTTYDGVWLAPADTGFVTRKLDVTRLGTALQCADIGEKFDRVILDTPPTLDDLLISAFVAAHGVVVPFIPHHLAKIGVRQLAKLFYQVATSNNPELKLFGLLPVMHDRHMKLHRRVTEDLGRQFGKHRILRGIRTNIKLAEAFEAGVPVSHYAVRSVGNMDYELLADELEICFQPLCNGGNTGEKNTSG